LSDGGRERTGALVGRGDELALIRSFAGESAVRGGVLLLSGEPGVGKTVLLDAAAEAASAAGMRVLRAAGVEFEADVSFSGLHQLLFPLLGEYGQTRAERDVLSVALGLGAGPPSDRLVVSNAALAVLRRSAAARPLLVIVDDLPWLDRASAAVLGFVARRLAGSQVGFLAALRSGAESFFERAGLPVHELRPLGEDAAATLVDARFPALAPRVRQRLLTESRGNPLALLELPGALSGPQRAAQRALPGVLPLGRRLQAVFASRISDLAAPARYLLLLAILDGTGDLGVLQAVAGGPAGLDDLAPAERARLVYVDEDSGKLAFRHPLTRSAVVELSTSGERRRAHRALAELSAGQPERRAWHLAEAAVGPDEEVAGLLEQVAYGVLRRGDAVAAVAALLRAADMSPLGSDRGRRMAEAAYVGADVAGDLRSVSQLLADARRADPDLSGSLHAAVAASYLLLNGDGDVDTAHRLLAGAIEAWAGQSGAGDSTLVEALHTLLLVCFFGGRPEFWDPFHAAIRRLMPHVPAALALLSKTFADPARAAIPALGQLDAAVSSLGDEADPAQIVRISIAAFYVDRLAGCGEPLWRVVRDGRQGGAVTSAIDALMLLSFDSFQDGRWDQALQLAEEGLGLCDAHGYRILAWPGRYGKALIAAARGDYDTARALADEMTRWALPRRVGSVRHYSCHVRALAALGQGDFEEAYEQATAISPAGVLASHVPLALWIGMDIVEAAIRTGRQAEAAAHVTAMRDAGIAAISPRIALLAGGAAAIAAAHDGTAALFDQALAVPGAERWPFDFARVQLAYGERLRRARATTRARTYLAAALGTFEHLGARPWVTRASGELWATGLATSRPEGHQATPLTPREREIAKLAAVGLSNKQIAERLFLTNLTVAAHLHQVFPKLGITSRAGLHDALASLPARQAQGDERNLGFWREPGPAFPCRRNSPWAASASPANACRRTLPTQERFPRLLPGSLPHLGSQLDATDERLRLDRLPGPTRRPWPNPTASGRSVTRHGR
jgi:DNA-binding CsgD family transcriptional regulator